MTEQTQFPNEPEWQTRLADWLIRQAETRMWALAWLVILANAGLLTLCVFIAHLLGLPTAVGIGSAIVLWGTLTYALIWPTTGN